MRYEGNIFRPPGEWKSYLLQVTIGCSHNTCTFCSMYKNKIYRERSLDEVMEDIEMARAYYGTGLRRVFLCDGDAINLPTDYLIKVLDRLYKVFPNLEKVTAYAGPQSTLRKTPEELKAIFDAGLRRAYLGVETGDGDLLLRRGKGVNAETMLKAGLALRECGMDLWTMIILGLAGPGEASDKHADGTVDIINAMKPHHLSALTYMPEPGTPLYNDLRMGRFQLLTDMEVLAEERRIIAGIECEGLHFTSNHASNYVPLNCTLKRDRDECLQKLDSILETEDRTRIRKEKYRAL